MSSQQLDTFHCEDCTAVLADLIFLCFCADCRAHWIDSHIHITSCSICKHITCLSPELYQIDRIKLRLQSGTRLSVAQPRYLMRCRSLAFIPEQFNTSSHSSSSKRQIILIFSTSSYVQESTKTRLTVCTGLIETSSQYQRSNIHSISRSSRPYENKSVLSWRKCS